MVLLYDIVIKPHNRKQVGMRIGRGMDKYGKVCTARIGIVCFLQYTKQFDLRSVAWVESKSPCHVVPVKLLRLFQSKLRQPRGGHDLLYGHEVICWNHLTLILASGGPVSTGGYVTIV